ncbi:dTMP kinase [Candidatus Atribacteria bacterium RBG_19FT_COMBO_35_14]|uniref:Thymidylate kinase n=1 Tax=Candidatus Sediminicultor quintus TaxID=1797291 RepID=A0A1F5AEI3_9BACT|nr:MAG: dTMP kinase [Candidatus Atribacteria bacterium RBG_19FT_COMBO_35_14]
MKKGLFITFEGLEGCGKTTQAKMLFDFLIKQKIPSIYTKEPGGTKIGDKIRKILLDQKNDGMDYKTEMLLFLASRAENVRLIILPALEEGKVVISDRFYDSTTAYQGYGRGIDLKITKHLNNLVVGKAIPDLTFILDIDPYEGLRRSASFGNSREMRFEEEFINKKIIGGKLFLERVRQGYYQLSYEEIERIKIIDANRSKEDIFEEIIKIVNKKLAYLVN